MESKRKVIQQITKKIFHFQIFFSPLYKKNLATIIDRTGHRFSFLSIQIISSFSVHTVFFYQLLIDYQ